VRAGLPARLVCSASAKIAVSRVSGRRRFTVSYVRESQQTVVRRSGDDDDDDDDDIDFRLFGPPEGY
jgi:hypothetical protein